MTRVGEGKTFDLVGVGFGPSNLSIAIAIAEHNARIDAGTIKANESTRRIEACFIEGHERYLWHPSMMIQGSIMQISFLKDFVTMRDPTSHYSFLNYLNHNNRLATFINRSTFAPSRREYADYMAWCANEVTKPSRRNNKDIPSGISVAYGEYGAGVKAIYSANTDSDIEVLEVESTVAGSPPGPDEQRVKRRARNLLISPGGSPSYPSSLAHLATSDPSTSSERIIHSSQYLSKVEGLLKIARSSFAARSRDEQTGGEPKQLRVAVIGGGQSAAEIFLNLHTQLDDLIAQHPEISKDAQPQVDLIIRRGALRPSDDSPFSNEVFDPAMTDFVYGVGGKPKDQGLTSAVGLGNQARPPVKQCEDSDRVNEWTNERSGQEKRDVVLSEAKATNYAVVNPVTLEAIYEKMYEARVEEDIRATGNSYASEEKKQSIMSILPYRDILDATDSDKGIKITLEHTLQSQVEVVHYDAVVCGTGYKRQGWQDLLFADQTLSEASSGSVSLRELFEAEYLSSPLGQQSQGQHAQQVDRAIRTKVQARDQSTSRNSVWSYTTDESNSPAIFSSGAESEASSPGTSPLGSTECLHCTGERPTRAKRDAHEIPYFGVSRDYKLELPTSFAICCRDEQEHAFKPTIWLQGSNEATHGISDTLLSVLAMRAGEITEGLLARGNF
ncbi:uncharacterized protein L969DRAFT_86461 [Mixia osmundae IAM 14324]|uniref:L-ornithine N(5)-monooxygenase [NAD(P)H] n=1 Tax=Mixia osmundae (strain CBS 9802 / IAM 14324 / JCM 22182 / KY 12970) TaxID=764103 RepID=G7E9B8_MIXOS|nr:uncharacterized protein L969DRAFT_86461 [Mixia osmundae IAM 14324]KEI39864.1 hypothetical protein L969DRAFT_86461 [Mixia osmundae IAM 14324]GAA99237.1 hypothetical protein E5Q_05931 [Mixia osmundae IAM 14324]